MSCRAIGGKKNPGTFEVYPKYTERTWKRWKWDNYWISKL